MEINWRITVRTWSKGKYASMTAAYMPFGLLQLVACESAISAWWGSRGPAGFERLNVYPLSRLDTLGIQYHY